MAHVLHYRLARREDIPTLRVLMEAAIGELQKPFLDPDQIAASRAIMGLDTQLIDDGTYFMIEENEAVAGCGAGAAARRCMAATARRVATRRSWTLGRTRLA